MDTNVLQVEWLRYEHMKPEVGGSSAGSHEARIFHMKNRMTVGSLMVLKKFLFFLSVFGFSRNHITAALVVPVQRPAVMGILNRH